MDPRWVGTGKSSTLFHEPFQINFASKTLSQPPISKSHVPKPRSLYNFLAVDSATELPLFPVNGNSVETVQFPNWRCSIHPELRDGNSSRTERHRNCTDEHKSESVVAP